MFDGQTWPQEKTREYHMPRENRFTIYDASGEDGRLLTRTRRTRMPGTRRPEPPLQGVRSSTRRCCTLPQGKKRINVPAKVIALTPVARKRSGSRWSLVHQVVNSREEEEEALASGWHDHPAKAIKVRIEALVAAGALEKKKELLKKIPKMGLG